MHNDFVIVGPASDPAGIRGEKPVEALQENFRCTRHLCLTRRRFGDARQRTGSMEERRA